MYRSLLALLVIATFLPRPAHAGDGSQVEATLVTQPGHRQTLGEGFAPDADGLVRVIVLLAEEGQAEAQLLADFDGKVHVHHRYNHLLNGLALRIDPADLPALRTHASAQAVHPDARVRGTLAESVPLVGAPQVWAMLDGGGQPVTGLGVRVAIVDSGIDYTHPALGGCLGPGCKVSGGYDYVHDDADPLDDHGHGTHVAGIVAADGLLAGIAPDAELLAYKVVDENNVGYASDVIAALERAVTDGADVINLSLGAAGTPDDPVSLAAQAAVESGCVVVASAGNHGPRASTVESPALAPGVIAVAATAKDDALADFSARGPVAETFALKPDLAAPGVVISSTVPLAGAVSDPSGWKPLNGTSMASPHVAGGAALLYQLHPTWSPAEVKAALMNYALDLGLDLYEQGAGRLDLPAAAAPDLLATPGSLSFGLPLLDGTDTLTLTVRNLTAATLTVTPTLTLAHVADGAGAPISPAPPVGYASAEPANLSLAPDEAQLVTIRLDIPPDAADGHYQGRVLLETSGAGAEPVVPLGFTLLSRVTVRVLDESGVEIDGWGHMAVLARVPQADVVVSNVPLQIPATFTVPSGDYHAQAYGRFGLYDNLLIPGLPPQVPYVLVEPVRVEPHAEQTITLTLADTRPYWLDATGADGGTQFINSWAASLRYQSGDVSWLSRLGQSYIRVLNTDLPDDWPPGFSLRLADTPPGVSFNISLQGAGFSPLYRDFVARHGPTWPAAPYGGFGFPIVGSADQVGLLDWERPTLDASTMPTFTVTGGADLATFAQRTDLPGFLDSPWIGWEEGAEGWYYPPNGANSSLQPLAPGLTRTLTVSGPQHTVYWAGAPAQARVFHRPFYTPNWTQTYPWDDDLDVHIPNETALQPLPPGQSAITVGAGPLFPALAFDNQPDAIQMRHPLLAGASGSPAVWGADAPRYELFLDSASVLTGTLPEYDEVPAPLRRWPDLAPGVYQLVISPTTTTGELGTVRAGFTLGQEPGADLNPPQVLDFSLSQRYDPAEAMTSTWTLSDAQAVALDAAVRLGNGPWAPLAVEPLEAQYFQARIEATGALTVSLIYTATDAAGNWLAWQSKGATAQAQTPTTLGFELDPSSVLFENQPVTVRIVGSLTDPGGQPLAETPAWLRLRAGGRFVGHVRDLTGWSGNYQTGQIDFAWTFIPSEIADAAGQLPISLKFDVGLYEPKVVNRILLLVQRSYLPLIVKETPP